MPSRTACAAASANRFAPRMCRERTCCIRRETKSWRPPCSSKRFSTKSRRGAESRFDTGTSCRTLAITVRSSTKHNRMTAGFPTRTARTPLDIEDGNYVPIIRDPARVNGESEAVFYFPGCGSERLFSQVGLATQAMLWHVGVQTVLPPGYLCCGYPQRGAGEFDKAEKIITDNRVLFHRVANTLNYLDIKTVVVSCGTCFDQLQGYKFESIFPGSKIMDIHEYLLEKGVRLENVTGTRYMYPDPCHSPMKKYDPLTVVNTLMNSTQNGNLVQE